MLELKEEKLTFVLILSGAPLDRMRQLLSWANMAVGYLDKNG